MSSAQSGFTLTELVVVLGVIAMLALPLWAMTSKDRLAVQQIQCGSNLKRLTMYALMYASDNGASLNYDYSTALWMGAFSKYDPHLAQLMLCPSAPPQTPQPTAGSAGAADLAWFTPNGSFSGSYALNGWLLIDTSVRYRPNLPNKVFRTESTIQKPLLTPVFMDSVWVDLWPYETDPPSDNLYTGAGATALPFGGMRNPPTIERCVITRHGGEDPAKAPRNVGPEILPGAINLGLADGHVETVRLEKLWNYYWHLDWNLSLVTFPHPDPVP